MKIYEIVLLNDIRNSVLIIALLSCGLGYAQEHLDSAYTLLGHISKGSMLSVDEGSIIVIGNGTDTFNVALGVCFARVSLEGKVLVKKHVQSHDKLHFFDNLNDVCIRDSIAYTWASGTPPQYLFKFNKYSGTLMDTINIPNSVEIGGSLLPVSMHWIDSHRLLLCSQVSFNGSAQTQLTIFDTEDNFMTHIINNYSGYNQHAKDAIWKDGRILILGDIRDNNGSMKSMATIVMLDTLGVVEWRFISPVDSLRIKPRTMIAREDGSVVFTQNFVKLYNDGGGNIRHLRPGFGKVSKFGELEWEEVVGLDKYWLENDLYDLMPAVDDDAYVAVGSQANFDMEEYLSGVDTVANGDYLQENALICKISSDGETQWTRYYSRTDALFSSDRFKSIKQHPNGGYLVTGEQVQYIPGKPLIRTWLIHLDEYGCLVPGCDKIVSTVSSNITTDLNPLIYPNPALDYLCIYQPENQKILYTIYDMQGQMMDSFSCSIGDMTKIVDIYDYPPCIYVLTKQYESGQIVSAQWVKTNH